MQNQPWRLIVDAKATGAWNMAVDKALLQSAVECAGPPTLRFYGWSPPTLSLGYNQDASAVDNQVCAAAGVDVVRRPTGGRAVLHDDEVTYSIVLPPQHPFSKMGVVASYKELSDGFVSAFHLLGVSCELAQPQRATIPGARSAAPGGAAACFDAPSWYELVIGGRKVVGSAQVRKQGALLQHGSIPLHLDGAGLYKLLAFSDDAVRQRAVKAFQLKAAGLVEATGREFTAEEVITALIAGFTESYGVPMVPGSLTPWEKDTAESLMRGKAV